MQLTVQHRTFRHGAIECIAVILALSHWVTTFGAASAQEVTPEAVREWHNFYYRQPEPEKFVEMVRVKAKAGVLKKSTAQMGLIGLYSQIMAQNPDQIRGWLKELGDLEEAERGVLLMSAWFSYTKVSEEYFAENKLEEYIKEKPRALAEIEVKDAPTLDLLWGMFLASGEITPVRRIVSSLDLSEYSGEAKKYKTSAKTEEDRRKALLDATFQAAMWSLEANCKQHPKVLEHCETIFMEMLKEHKPEQKSQAMYLGIVLSKVKPQKYKAKLVEVPEGGNLPKAIEEAPSKPK
jgi:hypothetical protein